jgi:3-oxoacyl-[acyl-carrier protein] reductase
MKQIIVTGDSRGLGLSIVKSILSQKKYGVIGISRGTNEAISELLEQDDNYTHLEFDLEQSNKIPHLYKDEIKKVGPIFGLVNNAAFGYDDIVTNARYVSLNKAFQINVISPILLSKYAIRDMLLNNCEGSLIHISSITTLTGYKGLAMYASTKGALESFSKGVAREWGVKGIRSNVVAPGFMETTMTSTLTEDQKNRIYNRTSLKKPTNEQSVTSAVIFLLSDEAKSITGAIIRVDNGTV